MANYRNLIDTQTYGSRYDVTPLFADYDAFSHLVSDLLRPFKEDQFDCIVGIDALGFILGTAVAIHSKKGFVPIRKGGKLPVVSDAIGFVDYTGQMKSLELRKGAITPGTRVLLVDEWVETGSQVKAAVELIERQGAEIVGIATINMDDNDTTSKLKQYYKCYSVLKIE